MTATTCETSTGWVTVRTPEPDAELLLPGEPTPAPGLVIVPAYMRTTAAWTGTWTVTHAASGRWVCACDVSLAYARETAARLASVDVDWTQPAEKLRTDPVARDATRTVLEEVWTAREDGRPLWWARPSWRELPALYRITGDPDFAGVVFRSWAEVLRWADTAADDAWSCPNLRARIVRDSSPAWELVCAAPLCGEDSGRRPAVVVGFDEDGTDFPYASPDRAQLAQAAREQGWRSFGAHWLCPDCLSAHPAEPEVW